MTSRLQNQKRRADSGMTLVELVIAVGVLAVALGMMFSSLISLYSMAQIAEGRTRAAMIMTSVVENMRAMDFETLMAWNPNPIDFEDADAVVVLEAIDMNGDAVELPSQAAAANFPNPMEVRVTVVWTQLRGRVYSFTASTLAGS